MRSTGWGGVGQVSDTILLVVLVIDQVGIDWTRSPEAVGHREGQRAAAVIRKLGLRLGVC